MSKSNEKKVEITTESQEQVIKRLTAELKKANAAKKVRAPRVIGADGLYEKSQTQVKTEATIERLREKYEEMGVLSAHDARIFANAKWGLEDKGATALFKFATNYANDKANAEELKMMLGDAKLPTDFKEFCAQLPAKQRLFSKWDAFGVFTKLNKGMNHLAKAANQDAKLKKVA